MEKFGNITLMLLLLLLMLLTTAHYDIVFQQ